MVLSGFLFLSWRVFEIVMTVPIVGMLGWFVHQYVKANILTPDYILVLFIVSVLALAWCILTVIDYARARHDGFFVAFVDLLFFGAFIGGVVTMKFIAGADCGNFSAGFTPTGGYITYSNNKVCSMLKASFAFGIIDVIAFFVTFFLALWVHHHHRNDDKVVVKREYRSSRHGGSRHRSGSRGYRSSRDYDRPRSSGRSGYSSRRQYYV